MPPKGKPVQEARDPRFQFALDYWQSKRQGRSMPSRADLDPVEFPTLLGDVILLDVEQPGPRLRVRLVGTHVVAMFGSDYTGQFLDEIDFGEQREKILADYGHVLEARRPYLTDHMFRNVRGTLFNIERLILPLSYDDDSVATLFAVLSFEQKSGSR